MTDMSFYISRGLKELCSCVEEMLMMNVTKCSSADNHEAYCEMSCTWPGKQTCPTESRQRQTAAVELYMYL